VLFGSYAQGTADRWSDIDLAVFLEADLDRWDLMRRAAVAAEVQEEAGDELELHFFPAEALDAPSPASFARYVLDHGLRIDPDEEESSGATAAGKPPIG